MKMNSTEKWSWKQLKRYVHYLLGYCFCFVCFLFVFGGGGSFNVSLTASLFVLQTMGNLGSSDVDSRLEEQLIDGILYAFQEQTQEVHVDLTHCAAVVYFLVLSERSKHW